MFGFDARQLPAESPGRAMTFGSAAAGRCAASVSLEREAVLAVCRSRGGEPSPQFLKEAEDMKRIVVDHYGGP
jgi:hypothetical protein